MNTILAATDLSPRGQAAIARAARLAAEQGAELELVHVVDEELPVELGRLISESATELIREQFDAARAALGEEGGGLEATIRILRGRPHLVLADRIEKGPADLLVMGRHRREPISDIFGVTTAERVLRLTEKPVLIVHQPPKAAYREAVIGVDFSGASEEAARRAAEVAPTARRCLVHVVDAPFGGWVNDRDKGDEFHHLDGLLNAFAAEWATDGIKIEVAVVEGPIGGTLLQEVERRVADLVAIGTAGRAGLERAVFGSVAQDVLERADCDVLVVRSDGRQ